MFESENGHPAERYGQLTCGTDQVRQSFRLPTAGVPSLFGKAAKFQWIPITAPGSVSSSGVPVFLLEPGCPLPSAQPSIASGVDSVKLVAAVSHQIVVSGGEPACVAAQSHQRIRRADTQGFVSNPQQDQLPDWVVTATVMNSTAGLGSHGARGKDPPLCWTTTFIFPPSSLYRCSATRVSRSSQGFSLAQT
jgi:hypothetical protein